MKIVKMFNANEIKKEIGIDILDFYDNVCNDSAVPWWVDNDEDIDKNYEKINSYFLTHGATLGEKVWIDVTW